MDKYAIIVAGGKGERMQQNMPKQFLCIAGKPILMHTISAFYTFDEDIHIVLVLPAQQIELWEQLCKEHDFKIPYKLCNGGETRFHSVSNGLSMVPAGCLVGVHDGVRPFVSTETLERCYKAAEVQEAVIPVVEAVDSIRFVDEKGNKSVDRSKYCMVQTPQVFQSSLLKRAFTQNYSPLFTDDASVVEALGEKVFLVDGNRENIKITTPYDLVIGEAIYSKLQKI